MNDFYDLQIKKLDRNRELNEKLKEFFSLVNDYLETDDLEQSSIIKNLIIQKAITELNFEELKIFRGILSSNAIKETGKRKMKLYELAAGLYNNINNKEAIKTPPFEIAGGKITKKVFDLFKGKVQEKTFDIIGGDIEYIGEGRYKIYLEGRRNIGRYATASTKDYIIIGYSGGNTIKIFDSSGKKSLGIVPIENQNEIIEHGKIQNDGYKREIKQRTIKRISFELKEYSTKIELNLIFNN